MPELPEVENVKLSLESLGTCGQVFAGVELLRADLRTPLKADLKKRLPGQSVVKLRRRAKFILFETEKYMLLSHLGMTGSWRAVEDTFKTQKHDHVILRFASGLTLVFNDPRRFGLLELTSKSERCRWLDHLGIEPLTDDFSGDEFFRRTRARKMPVKAFLMDQRQVVGVGNIYASEALFRAGIKPARPAGRVTQNECSRLVSAVRDILTEAIAAGGSTIRDYRNSHGDTGQFQARFKVYDRAGEPCHQCGAVLRSRVIGGRSTFWCGQCQR